MQLMPQRLPAEIEERSFEIIDNEFGGNKPFSGAAWEVARRIIHAAGDPSLAEDLYLPEDAVQAGVVALAKGAPIFTDTMMVKVGISERRLPRQKRGALHFGFARHRARGRTRGVHPLPRGYAASR